MKCINELQEYRKNIILVKNYDEKIKYYAKVNKKEKNLTSEIEKLREKRNKIFENVYLVHKGLEFLQTQDEEAKYLIEAMYMDKKTFKQIDIEFNEKFRNNEKTIGYARMNQIKKQGLEVINNYIDSFPENKIDYNFKI